MTRTPLNFCRSDGQLVGPQHPIPQLVHDFVWDSPDAFFGCNQLVDMDGRPVQNRIRGHAREYRSRTHTESVSFIRRVEDDRWADRGPILPWRCGGHPRVSLPFTLDGETIAADTDWRALVLGVIDQTRAWPRPKHAKRHVLGWAQRLYHLIAHTPQCHALSTTIAEIATGPSPRTRLAGWLFFCKLPGAQGMAHLYEQVGTLEPDELASCDPTIDRHDLSTLVQLAVAESIAITRTDSGLAAARRMVLEPGKGAFRLVEVLGAADPGWLIPRAAQILRSNPTSMVLSPLIAVQNRALGDVLPLWLSDLQRSTQVDRQLFVAAICSSLQGEVRAAALAELPSE